MLNYFNCIKINQLKFGNHMQNLTKLVLTECNLKSIIGEMFQGLDNLINLNLSKNELCELNAACFAALKQLKMLNLTKNRIKNLNVKCFEHSTKLEILDLSYNSINEAHPERFASLRMLDQLNLKRSFANIYQKGEKLNENDRQSILAPTGDVIKTHELDARNFQGLENLSRLNMSGNGIKYLLLKTNTYDQLINLKELHLEYIITSIKAEWFNKLQNLQVLNLTGCCIKNGLKDNVFNLLVNLTHFQAYMFNNCQIEIFQS
jgi:hypothetical protein